jgi:uncharacterized protein (TIGR00266 family)
MHYEIHGTTLQTLEITLQRDEAVYSQTHQMAWMSDQMNMETNTAGGFIKGLVRSLSGASLFLTQFSTERNNGLVAFCPRFPGKIVAKQLAAGESLICRKESFLCAQSSVQLDVFFRKQIGAGLFGGEGFILQKVTGPGLVFLDLSGEVVEKKLQPGEILQVHVGHVGVQDTSVGFDINFVKGWKNMLFGGEGMFLAILSGPGNVMLQSMPIVNLAEEIMRYTSAPHRQEGGASVIGDVIGGILRGNE